MKTSVGTLYNVKISQVVNLNNTIKKLKNNGYWIYGTDMDGTDYKKYLHSCSGIFSLIYR